MAKGKNKNKGSKNDAVDQQAAATSSPSTSSAPEASGDLPAPGLVDIGSALESMTIEELREEVVALRQQLQERDQLVSQLKAELVSPARAAPFADAKVPDVAQLRARLEALRKEQEEADNARDAAWSQLKSCVRDISKLASPDYVTSLVQKSQSSDKDRSVVDSSA